MLNEAMYKVLVVEDDPSIRLLYSRTFDMPGFKDPRYDVAVVASGEEGLEYYRENGPKVEVVVSDFDLGAGRMNGGDFLRRVSEEGAKFDPPMNPFRILASSHAGLLSEIHANVANLELLKPLRPSVLMGAINSVINKKSSPQV